MARPGRAIIVDGVVQMGGNAVVVGSSPHGGGIGVIAQRDIRAGEVVFEEEAPLVAAQKSTREPLHMQLAKRVLNDDERDMILEQMAVIYPRSEDEVEPAVLARARQDYQKSVAKLMQEQRDAVTEGDRLLSEPEMLLLVLKIAFSSFMGGIFVAGAMFNHSCRPNILSQPRRTGPGTCMVATRAIAAGEELCFSYLTPLEQSYRQRSKKFEFQHLSPLASSPWPAEMESFSPRLEQQLAASDAAAGAKREGEGGEGDEEDEEGDITREEAEGHLCHMQDVLDSLEESYEMDRKAFLKEVMSIKEEAQGLLHPRHIVLCRINNMAVRAAHELLVARPHAQWAALMLQCTEEVNRTWNAELLGPDHCDLARVARDRHVALEYLIQHASETLFEAFPATFGTWQKASKAELAARKDAARIAELYDEHS